MEVRPQYTPPQYTLTLYLCEQPYLEDEGKYKYDQEHHAVEQEVEDVGDQPVGPAAEAILLHHDQVFLVLILHHRRDEHLRNIVRITLDILG